VDNRRIEHDEGREDGTGAAASRGGAEDLRKDAARIRAPVTSGVTTVVAAVHFSFTPAPSTTLAAATRSPLPSSLGTLRCHLG